MSKLNVVRRKLRSELEAPPALRKFGSGGHPVTLGYVKQFKYPFQREKPTEQALEQVVLRR